MRSLFELFVLLNLFLINNISAEEKIALEKLIKISVNYDEKLKPNELKIKNFSDQDLKFATTKQLVPYYISIDSYKNNISFAESESKGGQNPKTQRQISKNAEETNQFDLTKVFETK